MVRSTPIPHPPDWPVVNLGDITAKIGSGATPRGGGDTYLKSRLNYALIRSQNVFDRWFDRSGLAFISDEQATALKQVSVRPGDLLLNITGDGITFSRCCITPEDVLPACVNQHVSIVRVNPRLAEPGYVLGFLTHPSVKSYIESFNAGGSRRAITKGHIESFCLPLPPLEEQKHIASVLDTLDDKIELNRRMNDTLEAMARATFKSWFVDFDPVRARAEGRMPSGMDAATAAVFPNSFQDSPFGKIPKGWQLKGLDEIADFLNGLALQKFPPDGEDSLPVIKIAQLRAGNTGASDCASSNLPTEYIVEDGDVLFSWSGTLQVVVWCGGRGALNQHLFKVTSHAYPKWFCYHWIREHLPEFQAIAAGKATTMGHIQRHHLSEAMVVVPNPELLNAADRLIGPLFQTVVANKLQSRTLAAIRDALLPKLISGEIRVKDAENLVMKDA